MSNFEATQNVGKKNRFWFMHCQLLLEVSHVTLEINVNIPKIFQNIVVKNKHKL
jgi:hypothetical protein